MRKPSLSEAVIIVDLMYDLRLEPIVDQRSRFSGINKLSKTSLVQLICQGQADLTDYTPQESWELYRLASKDQPILPLLVHIIKSGIAQDVIKNSGGNFYHLMPSHPIWEMLKAGELYEKKMQKRGAGVIQIRPEYYIEIMNIVTGFVDTFTRNVSSFYKTLKPVLDTETETEYLKWMNQLEDQPMSFEFGSGALSTKIILSDPYKPATPARPPTSNFNKDHQANVTPTKGSPLASKHEGLNLMIGEIHHGGDIGHDKVGEEELPNGKVASGSSMRVGKEDVGDDDERHHDLAPRKSDPEENHIIDHSRSSPDDEHKEFKALSANEALQGDKAQPEENSEVSFNKENEAGTGNLDVGVASDRTAIKGADDQGRIARKHAYEQPVQEAGIQPYKPNLPASTGFASGLAQFAQAGPSGSSGKCASTNAIQLPSMPQDQQVVASRGSRGSVSKRGGRGRGRGGMRGGRGGGKALAPQTESTGPNPMGPTPVNQPDMFASSSGSSSGRPTVQGSVIATPAMTQEAMLDLDLASRVAQMEREEYTAHRMGMNPRKSLRQPGESAAPGSSSASTASIEHATPTPGNVVGRKRSLAAVTEEDEFEEQAPPKARTKMNGAPRQ